MLAGVLEREKTPPRPTIADEPDAADASPEPAAPQRQGRGAAVRTRAAATTAKKAKPRTIHLPDDLYERVVLWARRRGKTTSDYVAWALERQVPALPGGRSVGADEDAA